MNSSSARSCDAQRRQVVLPCIFFWAITALCTSVFKVVTVMCQSKRRILCIDWSHCRTSEKSTQNRKSDTSAKLRSRTRVSSVLNWLLVVAILLGMLGSIPNVRGEEGHVIERFVHSPGLHFEPIGELYLSNRLWTVAVTIDLTPLAERVDQALTKIVEAQVLCTKAKGNGVHLRLLMDQWHEDFQETKDFIDGLLGFDEGAKGKRGLVNGIGAIAKSLFETMEAEDAQQINDRLSHLEQGQEGYFRTSGRQIEIVNATIFQLEEAEKTITKNEDTLRKTLREVNRRLDEGANRTALRVDMDEHFMLVEAVVQGVVRDISRIKKLIAGGKLMGTGVLSESHLLTVLKKAQLPKGLSFPVELRTSRMHTLEEVLTSSVRQFGNKLVAVLKIPLVTYEMYDVFATYGIPQRSSDELHSYLQPDSELLVIHGATQYVTMTYQQLNECRRLQGQYLCTEILPEQAVRTYSPCEVQMYTHPTTCEPKHVALQHLMLMRMHSGNTWLYVASRSFRFEPLYISSIPS